MAAGPGDAYVRNYFTGRTISTDWIAVPSIFRLPPKRPRNILMHCGCIITTGLREGYPNKHRKGVWHGS